MSSRSRSRSRSTSAASVPTAASSSADIAAEMSAADEQARQAKAGHISAACKDGGLRSLVDLAQSTHGLVNDGLRRTAWPLLLGCSREEAAASPAWKELPPHRDEGQVALDVNRAFVYYPREPEKRIDERKAELSAVIVEVLRRHPSLCYFQGYHDIVQVLLLVLGAQHSPPAVARLSLLRIRDFMLPSLDPAISHLELLPPILKHADPVLYDHLPKMQPFFALGATITMFAHVIQGYGDIARLFDFFLASDTIIPMYFFAASLISRREELLEIDREDVDIFHAVLGRLPQPLDLELLISQTIELYNKLPQHSLRSWAWWKVSSSSVLKAGPTPFQLDTLSLEDGEMLFQKQAAEMRRKQALGMALKRVQRARKQVWRYRRPGAYGLAIVVGIYAVWLGRNGGINMRYMNAGPFGDLLNRGLNAFWAR
ncbi:hypothetical protein P154DRAFT_519108 [Amniculicola lignicola CBS 123094]|uniref:Rab-GAP TBC domain-containing protein n=1 Tax=Amniculicola lignicola CBS 123094 TaxID=1392246 RepID=A0A6A5WSD9_9PLEO|nr:hypothetical protein P154DRAFT_519108 [Amniculicola lignicola CBS 123094]